MSDRELLELAAKAAGMNPTLSMWGATLVRGRDKGGKPTWNPLEDDGDAFRLMVDMGISPEFEGYAELATADELAATRRAIVRAAAEIGREME